MPLSTELLAFLREAIELIADIAAGKVTIEDARTRATALQAKAPEHLTDDLLGELDAKLEGLEHVTPKDPPPGGASER